MNQSSVVLGAIAVTFVVLFVVSTTLWREKVPRLVRTFTTSNTTETLGAAVKTIDLTIQNPTEEPLQNLYLVSWGDSVDQTPGNGIACQNLTNIEASENNGFRTCAFVQSNPTSISLRIQFPIAVSTFVWTMND